VTSCLIFSSAEPLTSALLSSCALGVGADPQALLSRYYRRLAACMMFQYIRSSYVQLCAITAARGGPRSVFKVCLAFRDHSIFVPMVRHLAFDCVIGCYAPLASSAVTLSTSVNGVAGRMPVLAGPASAASTQVSSSDLCPFSI